MNERGLPHARELSFYDSLSLASLDSSLDEGAKGTGAFSVLQSESDGAVPPLLPSGREVAARRADGRSAPPLHRGGCHMGNSRRKVLKIP